MKRTKHLSMLGTLIASLGISAPGGLAQNGLPIQTRQPVRLTVAPNASSPIAIKTLPKATCLLHAEGDNDGKHQVKLFADDEGVVRFHVQPEAESEETARFEVDCATDGKIGIFPLHLRFGSSPTADMPAPAIEAAESRPGDSIRPALSEDQALNLANDELVARGYPLRPDREKVAGAFATWLKVVTKPSRIVSSRSVANPSVQHSVEKPVIPTPWTFPSGFPTTQSYNWSGVQVWQAYLNNAYRAYDEVAGEWSVPTVFPETQASSYSSEWVGLDGDQTSDVVQAGTEQDANYVCYASPAGPQCMYVNTYWAFTEFVPMQSAEYVVPNFTVNPRDTILVQVWIGNPRSTPSLSGAYAFFNIENVTLGENTTISTPRCRLLFFGTCRSTMVNVTGLTADWIIERPTITVNGVQTLPDLALYVGGPMANSYAYTTDGTLINDDGTSSSSPFSPVAFRFATDMVNSQGGILSYGFFEYTSSRSPFYQPGFVWNNYH